MRKSVVFPFVALLLCACTSTPTSRPHEAVRSSAQESYDCLVSGEVEEYVSRLHGYETMTEEYRSQMRDVFAQYLAKEGRMRGGLSRATVVGDTILDSVNAIVFVEISFGDGDMETVLQPMLFADGKWMLK